MSSASTSLTLAWLAQGKIRLKRGDEAPRTIDSELRPGGGRERLVAESMVERVVVMGTR